MRLVLAGVGFIVLASATAGYATTRSAPTVPDVAGKPLAAAVHTLVEAGYYADTAPVTSGKVARGNVKQQDPRPGSTLARGKPVRLTVSIGEARYGPRLPNVRIPNVVGKTARNARAMLVQKKLTMATKFRSTVSSKDGRVIAQNPTFGVFRQYLTVTILVGR
jgi:beta-lactam-binding protein with PASTA domain